MIEPGAVGLLKNYSALSETRLWLVGHLSPLSFSEPSQALWVDEDDAQTPQFATLFLLLETIMGTLLLILLVLLLLGSVPAYPYSRNWGYYPSGGIGTVLVIVLILVLIGRI